MAKYICQYEQWPHVTWNDREVTALLGSVRHLQRKIMGQISFPGFHLKEEALLSTLTTDVIKSSEIEGEELNYEQVRSSIARRLGLEYAGMVSATRDVDGVVEMMLDATQKYNESLTVERLFSWQAALFPSGWSGMQKIDVGSCAGLTQCGKWRLSSLIPAVTVPNSGHKCSSFLPQLL